MELFIWLSKFIMKSEVIIGIFTLLGVLVGSLITYCLNKRSEERKENNFEKSIVKSINSELKTLQDLYLKEFVEGIENLSDGQMLLSIYSARQDFFIIFNSNSQFIGRIKNDELRNSIIKTYIILKRFLEKLFIYTDDYKKFKFEEEQLIDSKFTVTYKNKASSSIITSKIELDRQKEKLVYFTSQIKEEFKQVKFNVQKTLELLGNYS